METLQGVAASSLPALTSDKASENDLLYVIDVSETGKKRSKTLSLRDAFQYFRDPVSIEFFGAAGDGETDDTLALQAAAAANVSHLVVPSHMTLRIRESVTFSAPVHISGGGKLVLDWEAIGVEAGGIVLAGEGSVVEHLKFTSYNILENPPMDEPSYEATFGDLSAAIKIVATDCTVQHCRLDYQPKGILLIGTALRLTAVHNQGKGYTEIDSPSPADYEFIRIEDGARCHIAHNYIEQYAQGVLFSLSTDKCYIGHNIGFNCADHVVYISSGDGAVVEGNIGYGALTRLKVRGNRSVVTSNQLFGGSLTVTNRIALDHPTDEEFFSCTVSNNQIVVWDGVSPGLSVSERSSYPSVHRNITISGNCVSGLDKVNGPFRGIEVVASEIEGVTITSNVVENTVADGIIVSPLVDLDKARNITISSNTARHCGARGIALTCQNGSVIGNTVEDADQDGSSAAGILLSNCSYVSVMSNVVDDAFAGAGPGIRERGTSDFNVILGNIVRNCLTGVTVTGANTVSANNITTS